MSDQIVAIQFDKTEQKFLAFIFMEVFGGGSTAAIQKLLGDSVAAAKELRPIVTEQANSEAEFIELKVSQWRVMYESINAVIYGLGPAELQTCTGQYLHDVCNLNLRICSQVWDVYRCKYLWSSSTISRASSP